jgi:hypothetical protein
VITIGSSICSTSVVDIASLLPAARNSIFQTVG